MATYQDIQNITQRITDAYNQGKQKSAAKETELKTQYGYDQRIKDLEAGSKLIYDIDSALENLDTDVTARTAGRPVTEAMRRRIVSSERDPLTSQLRTASGSQNVRQQGLSYVDQLLKDALGSVRGETNDELSLLNLQKDDLWKQLSMEENARQAEASRAASRAATPSFDYSFLTDFLNKNQQQKKPTPVTAAGNVLRNTLNTFAKALQTKKLNV